MPDIGLGYLSASSKGKDWEVLVWDWNRNFSADQFKEHLIEVSPSVTGIKVFTTNFSAVKKTLAILKTTLSSCLIIIGGPHPSSTTPAELFEEFPEADFAIRGDGEEGLSQLLQLFSEIGSREELLQLPSTAFEKITNLVWKENDQVRYNPIKFIQDMDSLKIPSWELLEPKNYRSPRIDPSDQRGTVAPIIVTRGCPAPCTFCSVHMVAGRKIRFHTAEYILHELETLYHQYDVRQVMFWDTNFLVNKKLVVEICEGILEKNLQIVWDCVFPLHTRVDSSLQQLMRRAGCRVVNIAEESGSDKILGTINKGKTVREIKELVSLVKKNAIKVSAYFMFGFPQETIVDMQLTRDTAFSLGADNLFFNLCVPYPGTVIYKYALEKYQIQKIEWGNYSIYSTPYGVSEVPSWRIALFFHLTRLRYNLRRKL